MSHTLDKITTLSNHCKQKRLSALGHDVKATTSLQTKKPGDLAEILTPIKGSKIKFKMQIWASLWALGGLSWHTFKTCQRLKIATPWLTCLANTL